MLGAFEVVELEGGRLRSKLASVPYEAAALVLPLLVHFPISMNKAENVPEAVDLLLGIGFPLSVLLMFVLNRIYYQRIREFEANLLDRAHQAGWSLEEAAQTLDGWRASLRSWFQTHLTPRTVTLATVAGLAVLFAWDSSQGMISRTGAAGQLPYAWGWVHRIGMWLGLALPVFYAAHFLAYYVRTWSRMGDWVRGLLSPAPDGSPLEGTATPSWGVAAHLARHMSGVFFRGFVQVVFLLLFSGWLHVVYALASETFPAGAYGLGVGVLLAGLVYLVGPSWEADVQIRRHRDRCFRTLVDPEGDPADQERTSADLAQLDESLLDAREGSPLAAGTLIAISLLSSVLGAAANSLPT